MEKELLDEITACLHQDRVVFHYFKDRYALMLLEHAVGDGVAIAELKRGRFASLLGKPRVRALLATCGDGILRPEDLRACWPSVPWGYRLSYGGWPLDDDDWVRCWHQMTRRGHNLVVQLNFAHSHNRRARRILGEAIDEGIWSCHPIAGEDEITIGWTRVDVDLDSGEALIEEIQSDWMAAARKACTCKDAACREEAWRRYQDELIEPHRRVWQEALLAATLWVLRSEIGIRRIFLHTFETGNRLKHQVDASGPRSLYTALPRRFCFRTTHACPVFLKRERDKGLRKALIDPRSRWHVLEL